MSIEAQKRAKGIVHYRGDRIEAEIIRLEEDGKQKEAKSLRTYFLRAFAAANPRLDDSPERKKLRKEFNLLHNAHKLDDVAKNRQLPLPDRQKAADLAMEIRSTLL